MRARFEKLKYKKNCTVHSNTRLRSEKDRIPKEPIFS